MFHYTSRASAQEIAISRRLKLGPSGKLYFTTDFYNHGYEAADGLSILKTVELACSVSDSSIPDLSEERPVDPILDENGREIRRGGGTEKWTEQEVALDGEEKWHQLGAP